MRISITARRLLATQPLGAAAAGGSVNSAAGAPVPRSCSPSLGRPSPDELVVGALECSRPHLTPTSKWSNPGTPSCFCGRLSRIRAPSQGPPDTRPKTLHKACGYILACTRESHSRVMGKPLTSSNPKRYRGQGPPQPMSWSPEANSTNARVAWPHPLHTSPKKTNSLSWIELPQVSATGKRNPCFCKRAAAFSMSNHSWGTDSGQVLLNLTIRRIPRRSRCQLSATLVGRNNFFAICCQRI